MAIEATDYFFLLSTSALVIETAGYPQHHLLTLQTFASPTSTNCRVGVLFPTDMFNLLIDGRKSSVLVVLVNLSQSTEAKAMYLQNSELCC